MASVPVGVVERGSHKRQNVKGERGLKPCAADTEPGPCTEKRERERAEKEKREREKRAERDMSDGVRGPEREQLAEEACTHQAVMAAPAPVFLAMSISVKPGCSTTGVSSANCSLVREAKS